MLVVVPMKSIDANLSLLDERLVAYTKKKKIEKQNNTVDILRYNKKHLPLARRTEFFYRLI